MRKLLYILFLLSVNSLTNCGNTNNPAKPDSLTVAPTNLNVSVQIVGATTTAPGGDGSGTVNFIVSATNATSYQILLPTENKTLIIPNKNGGTANYIFTSNLGQTASYPVQITAFNGTLRKDTTLFISVYCEFQLKWSDEFDGTTLNPSNWAVETGIHVNNELQVYTSSGNYSISNSVLTITCQKVNDAGTYGSYNSARIKTQGLQSFKYGRIEARLKLPTGKGTWPAFWMLGESIGTGVNWPLCGEIDIMEYVGADPMWVQASLHSESQYGSNSRNGRFQLSSANDESQWHIYGMIWSPSQLAFYVDDYTKPYYTCIAPSVKSAQNWPFDNNFFIILNLAFGGDWGGYKGIDTTLSSMNFQIDWVRYYAH